MRDNKIYVFLSHSHLDYEKVRVVRNLLEREGFRPLMFFLKCLEKNGYEKLTKKLIKEEIDNRQRFVLCESENANKSDWVKFEVKHIKKTNRPYEVVNLEWPKERIKEAVLKFKIRSTVFLSYSRSQIDLARAVNVKLKMRDFKTFFDMDDIIDGIFEEQIISALRTAAEKGYVLIFLNENFRRESWQYKEIITALDCGCRIIPVVTSPLTDEAMFMFGNFNWIDVRNKSLSEASDHIIDCLMRIDSHYNQ